jgi:hypothetical protein
MDSFIAVKVQNTKKVTWGDVVVNVYFLEDGETLGRRKVQKGNTLFVPNVAEEHKDLVSIVCGADALCAVHIAPKVVAKSEDSDLLAALGML